MTIDKSVSWGERLASYVHAEMPRGLRGSIEAVIAVTTKWLVEEEIPRQIDAALERAKARGER